MLHLLQEKKEKEWEKKEKEWWVLDSNPGPSASQASVLNQTKVLLAKLDNKILTLSGKKI